MPFAKENMQRKHGKKMLKVSTNSERIVKEGRN